MSDEKIACGMLGALGAPRILHRLGQPPLEKSRNVDGYITCAVLIGTTKDVVNTQKVLVNKKTKE